MSNVESFDKLWGKRVAGLEAAGLSKDVYLPIFKQDYERVKQGNQPIDDTEAMYQLVNRVTGKSAAGKQERKTGFSFLGPIPVPKVLGNIAPSLADLVTSLPKLPAGLIKEAKEAAPFVAKGGFGAVGLGRIMAKAPKSVNAAIAMQSGETEEEIKERTGKLGPLGAIAGTPGIRLLPGSYTLPRLATGAGRAELQQNPVIGALDVLPYAGKVGRAAALASDQAKLLTTAERAAIRSGGRGARLTAEKALPEGTTVQALAANRPVRALSRATGLSKKVLDPLASKYGISKLDRQLAHGESVLVREEVDAVTREAAERHLAKRKELGFDDPAKASALHDAYINRKADEVVDPQTQAAFDYLDDFYTEVRNKPNSPFFKDLDDEWRSTNDPTGAKIKKLLDDIAKVESKAAKTEAKLADAAGRVFGGDRSPSQVAKAEQAMAHWESKLDKWAKRQESLKTDYQRLTTKPTRTSTGTITNPVPARFVPIVNQKIIEALREVYADDPRVIADIDAGLVPLTSQLLEHAPGSVDAKVFSTVRKEVIANWRTFKDEGADPGYLPVVTPAKAARLDAPNLLVDQSYTPSVEKSRSVLSQTPVTKDPFVGAIATEKEYAIQLASQRFEDEFLRQPGHVISKDQGLAEVRQQVRAATAANPEIDAVALEQQLLREQFRDYNPDEYGIKGASRATDEYIRAKPGEAVKRLLYKEPNAILQTMGSAQRLFKTTALLSTTYPANNLFGNLSLVAAEATPSTLKHVPQAWKAAWDGFRSGKPSELIPVRLPHGRVSNVDLEPEQAFRFNQGGKIAVFWKQLMDNRIAKGANTAKTKWFDLNARLDDFSRNLVYFEDLAKNGGDVDAAIRRAGEVINDFDELTALERNVIKQVIPFYTFQRHLFKYAFRYPADHPIRTQIVTGIIRQNLEEGDLPNRFKSMFWLAKPDANGEQWRVDARAINPFADFADNFTLTGFLASSSPLISGPIKAFGVSDLSGAPGYTRRVYNPETGRYESARDDTNWLDLLTEFVPQASRARQHFDPEGRYQPQREGTAFGFARQTIGVPGVGVNNTDRERFLAEAARIRQGEEAVQEAFRYGRTDTLKRIPGTVIVKGVPMSGKTAAKVIAEINKMVKETGWEGAPTAVLPSR